MPKKVSMLTLVKKPELIDDIAKGVKDKLCKIRNSSKHCVHNLEKLKKNLELSNNSECSGQMKRVCRCTYEDIDKSVFTYLV